jgi:hypothetical protein
VDRHDVHLVKSLGAVRALPHSILHTIFNALHAENVAACFERSILEPILADSTECELLQKIISYEIIEGSHAAYP